MTGFLAATGSWAIELACGGGLILLLAWAAAKICRQPVRRQRLGEWGMLAALLFLALSAGPRWLVVPLPRALKDSLPRLAAYLANPRMRMQDEPIPAPGTNTDAALSARYAGLQDELSSLVDEPLADAALHHEPCHRDERTVLADNDSRALSSGREPLAQEQSALTHPGSLEDGAQPKQRGPELVSRGGAGLQRASRQEHLANLTHAVLTFVGLSYEMMAALFLGRWLLGHLGLRRILSSARPAPLELRRQLRAICRGSPIRPRLLVSSRLRVPLSCGLWRSTILLPAALLQREGPTVWPWILRHELTHLERRDSWACLWFSLGQVFYFYLPWFWSLRRQVRLCQEYVADAAAAGLAAAVEDYAEFLLRFTQAPAVPAGASGVFGNSSDLFRRVTMLLQSPLRIEKRCPRKWSLATGGLLGALAVLLSGLGLRAAAAASPADPVKLAPAISPVEKQDQALQPGQFLGQVQQAFPVQNRPMMGPLGFNRHEGRLGVQVQTPNETLADQLDLPKGQGIVVGSVVPGSPADKAGIKPHDILLELDGKSVPSEPQRVVHMIQDMKADTAMNAIVLRKGKKEMIKGISLPEVKVNRPVFGQQPNFNQAFAPPAFAPNAGAFNQAFVPPAPNPGQAFGKFGAGFGFGAAGPRTVLTTTIRDDDHFTTRYQEGSLIITLTGTVAGGKAKLNKIQVQDGAVAHSYESTDKVPEEYRDKVKNLVQMSERSNIKMEIEPPSEPRPKQPPAAK
jgi:beta-lactamase regulating signal transducer with metallopeptidase domain